MVELITGGLFVITYGIMNQESGIMGMTGLAYHLFIVSSLIVIFFTDLKYQIIPDKIIALAVLVIFGYLVLTTFNSVFVYKTLFEHPLLIHTATGILAFLFFLFIYFVTRGRGMGFGDVKLSFLIGLILGPILTFLALYIAFLTGAGIGIILILWKKKGLKEKIPFGPFLVIGAFISLLFPEHLTRFISIFF